MGWVSHDPALEHHGDRDAPGTGTCLSGLTIAHLPPLRLGTRQAVQDRMKCEHCNGDGEVEVCTVCANEVENCECDNEQPTENEECPECHGDREVEQENDE